MTTKHIYLEDLEKKYGPLTFKSLLCSHRLGEEWTQTEMAKNLRVSRKSLSDLERGRKIPSIRQAIQIAKKIGIWEGLVIQLVLQAQVEKEKLNYKILVSSSNLPKKAPKLNKSKSE